MIKAIINTNETSSPNIAMNYIPLWLKSEKSLTGPLDYINLNIVVAILVGLFVIMILMVSFLVMKLIKFGGIEDELENSNNDEEQNENGN